MAVLLALAVALTAVAPALTQTDGSNVARASGSSDSTVFTTDDVSGNFVDPDERGTVGQREPVRPGAPQAREPSRAGKLGPSCRD